jgi:hypothetical protein
MLRSDFAKIINWNGTATRLINLEYDPKYKIGDIINPGLCWTDGGQFTCESKYGKYDVLFIITENVDGHLVNYDDEYECDALGCNDCEHEKEILINKDFEITKIYNWDEEEQTITVFLRENK